MESIIKLSGFGPRTVNLDAPATKLLRAAEAAWPLNPLNDEQLVFDNKAVLELVRDFDDRENAVEIKDVRAIVKGGGTQAMTWICALADQHGTILTLYAKGYAQTPTSVLVPYYSKFGFETEEPIENYDMDADGVPMRRNPR